jgi:hypothetical protein
MKNLVCNDCHSAIKFNFKLVGRDIDLILATQNFMSKENNTKPATQKRKNKIKQQIIKKKKLIPKI